MQTVSCTLKYLFIHTFIIQLREACVLICDLISKKCLENKLTFYITSKKSATGVFVFVCAFLLVSISRITKKKTKNIRGHLLLLLLLLVFSFYNFEIYTVCEWLLDLFFLLLFSTFIYRSKYLINETHTHTQITTFCWELVLVDIVICSATNYTKYGNFFSI